MTLGTFQPKARLSGDKLDLRQYAGRPLLVRTVEFVPDFSSRDYPEPKPVVFCDVVDLISGQIFINVLWGAGAVVDNLKDKAGTEEVVPVKAANVPSTKRAGTHYVALYPLEGPELDGAVGWYNTSWAVVNQTRAQRQAQAVPAQAAPAAQQQQFAQPATVGQAPAQSQFAQPVQGQMNQAPGQQFAQPPVNPAYAPQPQFGQPQVQPAPAQGFGAPQGGVFSDVPPGPAAGQVQFAPPQGTDPAAVNAALAHLNQQQG